MFARCLVVALLSVPVGQPCSSGGAEPFGALFVYHATSSEVLVFEGHAPDAGVQPDRVVLQRESLRGTLGSYPMGMIRPTTFSELPVAPALE